MEFNRRGEKMKKEIYKKGFVFGAVAILLTVALFTPLSAEKNIITINNLDIEHEEAEKVKYEFVFNNPRTCRSDEVISTDTVKNNQNAAIFSVELLKEDAVDLEKQLNEIKSQLKIEKNPQKIKELTDKALKLYVTYGVLPKCFTYVNITNFIEELSTSFTKSFVESGNKKVDLLPADSDSYKTQEDNGSSLTLNFAAPVSCLSYFSLLGTVNPFGISHLDGKIFPYAIKLMNMTIINVTLNSTGIFIENESLPDIGFGLGKWLENIGPILLTGKIWQSIWEKYPDYEYRQYKMFWTTALYNFIEILVGNAISSGMFTGLQLDGRDGEIKLNQRFVGNFLWVGSPYTLPFSFTLYKTWPQPWTVALEIGVVPCAGISGLISLLYLEPQH